MGVGVGTGVGEGVAVGVGVGEGVAVGVGVGIGVGVGVEVGVGVGVGVGDAVGVGVGLIAEKISAEAIECPAGAPCEAMRDPSSPPAATTWPINIPVGISVATRFSRAVFKLPVWLQVPSIGSYNSESFEAVWAVLSIPPAART